MADDIVAKNDKKVVEPSNERWEWLQLSNAIGARYGQDSVLWTIIGSFWATNSVLLVALGATGAWASAMSLRMVVCVSGLFVSVIWLVMQAAALRKVHDFEDLIHKLEKNLELEADFRLYPNPDKESEPRGGSRRFPYHVRLRARDAMPWVPPAAILFWFLLTCWAPFMPTEKDKQTSEKPGIVQTATSPLP